MLPRASLPTLLGLLALLPLAIGSSCHSCWSNRIVILTPAAGVDVTTFSFPVEIQLADGVFDISTLEVTLNAAPLTVTGGPTLFTATVDPGPPLRDHNTLRVRAKHLTGGAYEGRVRLFRYLPPKARARMIRCTDDLITGPLAHNRIGDYLLENAVARYAIQDVGQRDLHSVGQFGGNLIDAELVGRPGRDSFFEIQPAINVESVINAERLEIVNDGQDGTAAIIRTCGPDDLLDYINPSSQISELGLDIPLVFSIIDDRDYEVEGCTEYRLEPETRYLEIETTVYNNDSQPVSFYVGDYVNGMGQMEQWTRTGGGPAAGLGEILVTAVSNTVSFLGFGSDEGVDYALVPITFPGGAATGSSTFSTSGVTFMMHSNLLPLVLGLQWPPLFDVPANGNNSFLRYFAVGDGSLSNGVEMEAAVKGIATGTLSGCVRVDGAPAPSARVAVGPMVGGAILTVDAHFVTGADGCYSGAIPAGSYGVAAAKRGVPYEGGGTTPVIHPVTVPASGTATQDIDLPATGRVRVEVVNSVGTPIPARVSVVGIDPTPEPLLFGSVISTNDTVTGLFNDVSADRLNSGFVAMALAGADGVAEFDLEPGSYQVVVSRGTEYSIDKEVIQSNAGATALVEASIAEVLDTTGFISSDFHVHLINSPDSRIDKVTRSLSFAAEGVDNIIATDHDAHTDLNPTIAALGLTAFVHATVGEEITSFDYGHYNAYPQGVDPDLPSGGSTDWAGWAPAGYDFPSFGNYVLTPAEIEAAALGSPLNSDLETVVQINHIDSHFAPLEIDTAATPPQSFLADPTFFRLDPSVGNFFHPFKALELWNGASRGAQEAFLKERIGIWMNLLNQGIISTAIADTDTHSVLDLETAGARSWTPSPTDAPAEIDDNGIGLAVKAGKLVGGQGVYVQTRLVKGASTAHLGLGGSTMIEATDGLVDLEIDVQAPEWAPYDTIEIYANAATCEAASRNGTPVLFGALPTLTLTEGAGDFSVNSVPVAGAAKLVTEKTVPLAVTEDSWVVVVVKGTEGVSPPMFPVHPRNLDTSTNTTLADLMEVRADESGVRALGFTNPLFIDFDGDEQFDAPGVPAVVPCP